MIKSFRHKGLQQFYETGSKAGIAAEHEMKLARQLLLLNVAKVPQEMNITGWNLHPLPSLLKIKTLSWLIIKTITNRYL
jgi:proteic killer suppression protein